jgi:hypothetical protein
VEVVLLGCDPHTVPAAKWQDPVSREFPKAGLPGATGACCTGARCDGVRPASAPMQQAPNTQATPHCLATGLQPEGCQGKCCCLTTAAALCRPYSGSRHQQRPASGTDRALLAICAAGHARIPLLAAAARCSTQCAFSSCHRQARYSVLLLLLRCALKHDASSA